MDSDINPQFSNNIHLFLTNNTISKKIFIKLCFKLKGIILDTNNHFKILIFKTFSILNLILSIFMIPKKL